MAKNAFTDWSTTPSANTDIAGIGTQGTNLVSNFDDAFRTLMAQLASGVDPKMVFTSRSSPYTAVKVDNGKFDRYTAAATIPLTAAATLTANWHYTYWADGADIVIDPNLAETINGAATLTVKNGECAFVYCTGTAFLARVTLAPQTLVTKSGNYTGLETDYGNVIRFSAAATYSIDVTANLRTNWYTEVWADGGSLIIDPNSTDTINGAATITLLQGQKAKIFKTGSTTFQAGIVGVGDTLQGPQLQGYSFGLALTTNATDAVNDIDMAPGAAAADTSPYNLIQLATTLTKRIDAAWAVGNNNGGLDTGSVANATYYIWLIQRSDTGVTDWLYSLSSTAPTMPTNYTQKGPAIGMFTRAAGVNGPITWLTTQAVGVGQNLQDVTASRAGATSYQNTTRRPIMVVITARSAGGSLNNVQVSSDNFVSDTRLVGVLNVNGNPPTTVSFIVKSGEYYRTNLALTLTAWSELR